MFFGNGFCYNKIVLILALLPTLIIFGPMVMLQFTSVHFDAGFRAISDLNNFPETKYLYGLTLVCYQISQSLFLYLKSKFSRKVLVFSVGSISALALSLFFSSHSIEHIFLAGLSFVLMFVNMAMFRRHNKILLLIGVWGVFTAIAIISPTFTIHPLWIMEYLLLFFIGIWNLMMVSR